jgi:hypothetical protein
VRRWGTQAAAALLIGIWLLLAGCSASPEDPAEGELTGVVITGNDHGVLPLGGGVVREYDRLAVLTTDDWSRLLTGTWPDASTDPAGWEAAGQGFRIPLDSFVEGDDPMAGPVLWEMDEGRWRMPWDGGPAMLCVGQEALDDLSLMGCRLLEAQAPVAVTLTVHIGGLSLDVES